MAHQERSVDLFRLLGDQNYYHYALDPHGRDPPVWPVPASQQAVLGPPIHPEELAYLESGGFSA